MDKYESLRSLHPMNVLNALGVNTSTFKKRSNKPEWYGKCPIHHSKNNNTCFSIHEDGRFGCFSCEAKGRGALDLAMQVLKIGFKEACERLGSIPAPTAQSPNVEAPAARSEVLKPILKDTWRNYQVPCEWLEARCPDKSVREAYGVYCYNNPARKSAYSGRVMIPVKDAEGVLYGYLGRDTKCNRDSNPAPETAPKYLLPKNLPKSQFLFGAWELSRGLHLESVRRGEPHSGGLPLKVLYLVESPLAVLHFASLGLPCVAAYGWSVSEQQAELLKQLTRGVVALPDANKAGREYDAVIRELAQRVWVRFPSLPVNDPEQLDKETILALTH